MPSRPNGPDGPAGLHWPGLRVRQESRYRPWSECCPAKWDTSLRIGCVVPRVCSRRSNLIGSRAGRPADIVRGRRKPPTRLPNSCRRGLWQPGAHLEWEDRSRSIPCTIEVPWALGWMNQQWIRRSRPIRPLGPTSPRCLCEAVPVGVSRPAISVLSRPPRRAVKAVGSGGRGGCQTSWRIGGAAPRVCSRRGPIRFKGWEPSSYCRRTLDPSLQAIEVPTEIMQ
jgi:hypothetical protein